jgi:hypothetical protein
MKTLFTAIVAIAIGTTASATHLHHDDCPANCSAKTASVSSTSKSYDQKVADLKNAADEKAGLMNYNRSMQFALNQVAKQKHIDAIANIESEGAYNNLMSGVISNLEQQKVAEQMEDLTAEQRFANMMHSIFTEAALK